MQRGLCMRLLRKSYWCSFGDCTDCVFAEGWFRLIAADQFRKANDCCVPKQSLQVNCLIGPLYTSKLPLESDDHPVTALPCVIWSYRPEAEFDLFRFNVRKQSLHTGHTLFDRPRCVICISCQIAGSLLYLGSGPNLGVFDKSLQWSQ